MVSSMMKILLGDGLVMSEGGKHEAHKRLMSPSFNNTSIRSMNTYKTELLSIEFIHFLILLNCY